MCETNAQVQVHNIDKILLFTSLTRRQICQMLKQVSNEQSMQIINRGKSKKGTQHVYEKKKKKRKKKLKGIVISKNLSKSYVLSNFWIQ